MCKGPSCSSKSKDALESWFTTALLTLPDIASHIRIDYAYCFGQCFKGPNAAFSMVNTGSSGEQQSSHIVLATGCRKKRYEDSYFEHYIDEESVAEMISFHYKRISSLRSGKK